MSHKLSSLPRAIVAVVVLLSLASSCGTEAKREDFQTHMQVTWHPYIALSQIASLHRELTGSWPRNSNDLTSIFSDLGYTITPTDGASTVTWYRAPHFSIRLVKEHRIGDSPNKKDGIEKALYEISYNGNTKSMDTSRGAFADGRPCYVAYVRYDKFVSGTLRRDH